MAEADTSLAGLRWVASAILSDTIKQGFTCLKKEVPREIEDLEKKLIPRLKSVIAAAKGSPEEIRVKKWLEKVKFILYDVEDLLDEHEYERIRHQVRSDFWFILSVMPWSI
jgi:Rx N-terminal domain